MTERKRAIRGTANSGTPEYHREWRKKHPESVKAATLRYHSSPWGKRVQAARDRERNYGITSEQFDVLVIESGGYCSLCFKQSERSGPKELVVDHCHLSTGKIRGLICNACNTMLGYVEKYGLGLDWFIRAKEYVV